MTRTRRAAAALIVIVAAGCAGGTAASELEQAEQRWAGTGIVDYTLTVRYGCFCPRERVGPFEVEVIAGEVASVRLDGEQIEPTAATTPEEAFTVAGLFGIVRSNADADRITVTYDDRGVPVLIDIDRIEAAADDELQVTAEVVAR